MYSERDTQPTDKPDDRKGGIPHNVDDEETLKTGQEDQGTDGQKDNGKPSKDPEA